MVAGLTVARLEGEGRARPFALNALIVQSHPPGTISMTAVFAAVAVIIIHTPIELTAVQRWDGLLPRRFVASYANGGLLSEAEADCPADSLEEPTVSNASPFRTFPRSFRRQSGVAGGEAPAISTRSASKPFQQFQQLVTRFASAEPIDAMRLEVGLYPIGPFDKRLAILREEESV
jgi:hypothetical protein